MADVAGVARLVLAAVFLVAGWAKLSDRPATRQAVEDLGVPHVMAPPVGVLLPLAELAVAVALLISGTARAGAAGALVLLGLFIIAITVSLARGRRPNCNCFGQVHSAPIGTSTLVRNIVLAGLAAVVLAKGPGAFVSSWISRATAIAWVGLAAAVAIALLAWFVLNLTAQQGRLLDRIDVLEAALGIEGGPPEHHHGLPLGDPAPGFELESTSGELVSLEDLLSPELPALLLFTSTNCHACDALLPEVAAWQAEYAGALTIAVVGEGDLDANRVKASEAGLGRMLLQQETEVASAYGYLGTPSGVVVSATGVIASAIVAGSDAIKTLTEQAAAGTLPSQRWVPVGLNGGGAHQHEPENFGPAIGDPAPEISLPDLTGKTVSSAELRGHSTLVLFWRQSCGFCASMLDDLRAWDRSRGDRSPQLLVVSSGKPEEHADMGLASTVVLDQTASVMSSYGANGTPMAVLVDADGRIASALAVGAVAVMDLARS